MFLLIQRGKMQRENNKNKNTELEKTKELNTNTQASSFQNKKIHIFKL